MTPRMETPTYRRRASCLALALLCLLVWPVVSVAAPPLIEGSYLDRQNTPMDGWKVVAWDDQNMKDTRTDGKGEFHLPNGFTGTITLQVVGPHGPQTVFNLQPGKHQELNLVFDDSQNQAQGFVLLAARMNKMDPTKISDDLKKLIIEGDLEKLTTKGIRLDSHLPEKTKNELQGDVKDQIGDLFKRLPNK